MFFVHCPKPLILLLKKFIICIIFQYRRAHFKVFTFYFVGLQDAFCIYMVNNFPDMNIPSHFRFQSQCIKYLFADKIFSILKDFSRALTVMTSCIKSCIMLPVWSENLGHTMVKKHNYQVGMNTSMLRISGKPGQAQFFVCEIFYLIIIFSTCFLLKPNIYIDDKTLIIFFTIL